MAHLLKSESRRQPGPAHVRAMIADLKELKRAKRAREDAVWARRARHPLHQTRALPDGARFECFPPPTRYWDLRHKYGRELFTTDAGQKDLKRHHPEWFTKTVADRQTFGLSARGRANYEKIFKHR